MAAADLGVAKHLDATYYPKPLEIICYHCQQLDHYKQSGKGLLYFCLKHDFKLNTLPIFNNWNLIYSKHPLTGLLFTCLKTRKS
jgi:hypothetical protein